MNFSNKLRFRTDLINSFRNKNNTFTSIHEAQNWYRAYLLDIYYIIRASVPLMEAAYNECLKLKTQNKLSADLSDYFKTHIIEETNHDEWVIGDLESLGFHKEQILNNMPKQNIFEMVGCQYYLLYFYHPICLLGYIAILEGNPPHKDDIEYLQNITGYPEKTFSTMIKHSDLDPYHKVELDNLLDRLPLDKDHESWIMTNALYTANKIVDIWKSL